MSRRTDTRARYSAHRQGQTLTIPMSALTVAPPRASAETRYEVDEVTDNFGPWTQHAALQEYGARPAPSWSW